MLFVIDLGNLVTRSFCINLASAGTSAEPPSAFHKRGYISEVQLSACIFEVISDISALCFFVLCFALFFTTKQPEEELKFYVTY